MKGKLDSSLEELVFTFAHLLGEEDKKYVDLVNRMLGDRIDKALMIARK